MLSFQIVCAKFVARNRSRTRQSWRLSWADGTRLENQRLAVGLDLVLLSKPLTRFLHFPSVWIIVLMAVAIAFYIPVGVKRGGFQGACAFPLLATNFTLESAVKLIAGVRAGVEVRCNRRGDRLSQLRKWQLIPFLVFNLGAATAGTDFIPATSREGVQAIRLLCRTIHHHEYRPRSGETFLPQL